MARTRPSLFPAVLVGLGVFLGSGAVAWALRRSEKETLPDWLQGGEPDIEEGGEPSSEEPTTAPDAVPKRLTDLTEAKLEDLVPYGSVKVHRETAAALKELTAAARADGIEPPLLNVISGYRSLKSQQALWARALTKYRAKLRNSGKEPTEAEVVKEARRWVAPPGKSTHQTGRAVDFDLGLPIRSEVAAQARTKEVWRWLNSNAQRFGFVPYEREPWHWEFVGVRT